jgi:hypothetical protein
LLPQVERPGRTQGAPPHGARDCLI